MKPIEIGHLRPLVPLMLMFAGALIFFAFAAWAIWTAPRCLESHDEPRWIPEECLMNTQTIGEVTISTWDCEPAHWGKVWVCDQYEVERP